MPAIITNAPNDVGSAKTASRRTLPLVGLVALGAAAIAFVIRSAGPHVLADALWRARWVVPWLAVLEAVRLAFEILGTATLAKRLGRSAPFVALVRSHVVGLGIASVLPMGRPAAEAAKATMLAPDLGRANAAAIAVTNQALCMFSGAVASAGCAVAAFVELGPSAVTYACAIAAILPLGTFATLEVGTRTRWMASLLRRFTKLRVRLDALRVAFAELPVFPPGATLAWCASRGLLVLEIALLFRAVGGARGIAIALAAAGVHAAGATVGDFLPAQLGATDGAFSLSAEALHLDVGAAVAVALLLHFVQLACALSAVTVQLAWRKRHPAPRTPRS